MKKLSEETIAAVKAIVSENHDKRDMYLDGMARGMLGWFVGKVLQRVQGRADPLAVEMELRKELEK